MLAAIRQIGVEFLLKINHSPKLLSGVGITPDLLRQNLKTFAHTQDCRSKLYFFRRIF
jgi:hypothetical protein